MSTIAPLTDSTCAYETVKIFELWTDVNTKVRVEVSRRKTGHSFYRIATFRVYGKDGRCSPWLGLREMRLKAGLEAEAMKFIAEEQAKEKAARDGASDEADEAPEHHAAAA